MPKNNGETNEVIEQENNSPDAAKVHTGRTSTMEELDEGTTEQEGSPSSDEGDVQEADTEEAETFPREYVEQLRGENARYRTQAKTAEDLGKRLHVALTAATGRLADPTDMPFDEAHLEDPAALDAAIDELIESKPHLKSRRVTGDVGQGASPTKSGDVDLLGILRERAN